MISIIDYDAGNIMSVQKACAYLGHDYVLTRDREKILNSDHVILPGVGAFGDAMERLERYGMDETLKEVIPGFHDTPGRYKQLTTAIERDAVGRRSDGPLPRLHDLKASRKRRMSILSTVIISTRRTLPLSRRRQSTGPELMPASRRRIFLPVSSIRRRAAAGD